MFESQKCDRNNGVRLQNSWINCWSVIPASVKIKSGTEEKLTRHIAWQCFWCLASREYPRVCTLLQSFKGKEWPRVSLGHHSLSWALACTQFAACVPKFYSCQLTKWGHASTRELANLPDAYKRIFSGRVLYPSKGIKSEQGLGYPCLLAAFSVTCIAAIFRHRLSMCCLKWANHKGRRPVFVSRHFHGTQNEMLWNAGIQMKWICDHRSWVAN